MVRWPLRGWVDGALRSMGETAGKRVRARRRVAANSGVFSAESISIRVILTRTHDVERTRRERRS